MRLDWIFLPRENPCAKLYIIIIIILIMMIMIITTIKFLLLFLVKTVLYNVPT